MRFCLIAAPTPNAAATMTWRLDDTSTTVQDALSAAAECPVEGGGTACVLYLDIQSPDAAAACTSTSPALAAASAPTTDLSPLAGATGAAASSTSASAAASTSAALEVEITGERSFAERDAEARKRAVDLEEPSCIGSSSKRPRRAAENEAGEEAGAEAEGDAALQMRVARARSLASQAADARYRSLLQGAIEACAPALGIEPHAVH